MIHRAVGDLVAGHYRLERLLGEGGMGEVWAARDERDPSPVALKLLKQGSESNPEKRRRFLREARAAMTVDHPNIVRVREVATDEEAPVIVMELLEGETLRARLTRGGPMSVADLAHVMLPVVSALGTAHARGVVHRDLKPENLFLARTRTGEVEVKVLDFGIAKLRSPEGAGAPTGPLTETGTLIGTPQYMSPEQVFGEKDVDHRSDIWSLGAIVYECLTGRHAFVGDNVGQIIKAITSGRMTALREVSPLLPPALLDVCERMLKVDRAERPSDLREVAAVMQGFTDLRTPAFEAATLEVGASSTDGTTRSRSARSSTRLRVAAAWTAAAVTVGAIGVLATTGLRRGAAGSGLSAPASSPLATLQVSATATALGVPSTVPPAPPAYSAPASSSAASPSWHAGGATAVAAPRASASSAPQPSAAPPAQSARNVLPGGVAAEVPY